MPLCYSPWTNFDIDTQGKIQPCCKFKWSQYPDIEPHNIISSTLTDYAQDPVLDKIKHQLENNEWPAGCMVCQSDEKNGVKSKRQMDYVRWKDAYHAHKNDDGFITTTFNFGNTCNLKCITCGPSASSLWYKEHDIIYKEKIKPNHFYYKQGFLADLILNMPNLIHMDISGGEPMISAVPEQLEILDNLIVSGQSKNVTLHYTTNTTTFAPQLLWDKWRHFKAVDIQFSIDGVGQRYNYIRFPGKWETVQENVSQYLEKENELDNIKLSVSHTVSAYNIFYLKEMLDWLTSIGLGRPYLGPVHRPAHLSPGIFPNEIKNHISKKLKEDALIDTYIWSHVIHNVSSDKTVFDFCNFTDTHDQYRGTNFAKTFPELHNLIDEYIKNC
jgi:MoaA/NifB/PqqE/SkfB family radical SAM enzyme